MPTPMADATLTGEDIARADERRKIAQWIKAQAYKAKEPLLAQALVVLSEMVRRGLAKVD
jgi:hypothetical protein